MSEENLATISQMIESLPEGVQNQVIEHLREYIVSIQDELHWDNLVQKTQDSLIKAAQKAKQEIAEGKAQPMDYDLL